MEPSTGALIASPVVLLGLLAWSLKRNVKASDEKLAAAEASAKAAAEDAKSAVAGLAADVKAAVGESAAETRRAVDGLAGEVRALAATLGAHGERLARGDEKLSSLERRVDGLEDRERDRGCVACKRAPAK